MEGLADAVTQQSLPCDLEVVLVGGKGPVAVTKGSHASVARTFLSAAAPAATGWCVCVG